ncbi:hypothetical protein cce_4882 [Crocosphaera subtropica ATCC 51142]|uniref:Uncharacterized protein n=1 Tax=Crocosphaera subtropica (strain ATCC 51142 / BH68) TaxID=43989 RepID=B1X267_CROS5|nr:hypothetical protein cce_4882 [Crocosphaera subtropica ATCC 51142]
MEQKTNKTAQAFQQLEVGLAELLESGDWQRIPHHAIPVP